MKQISILYHSGYGHTKVIAENILKGLQSIDGISAKLISVDEIKQNPVLWGELESSKGIIFGSPTYMGSVSAAFKEFMDTSSKIWFEQKWKDKLAGCFTNSMGLSGDKFNTLVTLTTFAAQHSMINVSQGIFDPRLNRLSSWLGLMAQSDNDTAEKTPPQSDRDCAFAFGKRFGEVALKFNN